MRNIPTNRLKCFHCGLQTLDRDRKSFRILLVVRGENPAAAAPELSMTLGSQRNRDAKLTSEHGLCSVEKHHHLANVLNFSTVNQSTVQVNAQEADLEAA